MNKHSRYLYLVMVILAASCAREDQLDLPDQTLISDVTTTLTSWEEDTELQELVSSLEEEQGSAIYSPNRGNQEEQDNNGRGNGFRKKFGKAPIFDLVDWTRVRKVNQPSLKRKAWAVATLRSDNGTLFLDNLILIQRGKKRGGYIVRYLPDDPDWFRTHTLEEDQDNFTGDVQLLTFHEDFVGLMNMSHDGSGSSSNTAPIGSYDQIEECWDVFWGHWECQEIGCDGNCLTQTFTIVNYEICVTYDEFGGDPIIAEFGEQQETGGGSAPIGPVVPLLDLIGQECSHPPVGGQMEIAPTGAGNKGARFGYTRAKYTSDTTDGDQLERYFHDGLDVKGEVEDDILAMYGGTVVGVQTTDATPCEGYGKWVEIETTLPSGTKVRFKYNHLSTVDVAKDDVITGNTKIGEMGRTGNVCDEDIETHVHIQAKIEINGNFERTNPESLMSTRFTSDGNSTFSVPCTAQ